MRRVLAAVALLMTLLTASPAVAATLTVPGDAPLAGTLVDGYGAWSELPWVLLGKQTSDLANLRSVERLPSGDLLVACAYAQGAGQPGVVKIISPSGAVLWSYTEPAMSFTPWSATMTPDGNVLIVSRFERRVFVVTHDSAKQIVWDCDPSLYQDPFQATRLGNGNVLICDDKGGKVIEVGYDPQTVVWEYHPLTPTGQAAWPKYAQRVGTMTYVSTDNGVFEADAAAQQQLLFPGLLNAPASALLREDGTFLISEEEAPDSSRGRVIVVDRAGNILTEFATGGVLAENDVELDTPRRALPGENGSIIIADQNRAMIIELGHAPEGTGASAGLDCGLPGVRKHFTALDASVDLPAGTSASIEYAIDGGAWQQLTGTALPAETYGTLIAYRVTMTTTQRDRSPRLLGVTVTYEPAPESPTASGTGTGTGSGTGSGSRAATRTSTRPGTQAGTGVMASGSGYTAGGTITDATVAIGPLSVQRGWSMAVVGSTDLPGVPGGDGGPAGGAAPSAEGLLAIGAMYGAGMLSVPLQYLFLSLFRRFTR